MANRISQRDGGLFGRSKCTAVFFLLLLAGKEVCAVRDNTIQHQLEHLQSDLAVGIAARGVGFKVSTNSTVRALFKNAAERKARVDEWRSRLRAHMQMEDEPTLCKSTNWAQEREKFQVQVSKIEQHCATVYEAINTGGANDKWLFAEAKTLSAEAKALTPCLKAEKSGKISDTVLDPELKQDFEEGPDRTSSGADSFLFKTYATANAAAWAALMTTNKLTEYRESSGCKLGWPIEDRPLDTAFRAKPACFDDCESPELKAKNFPEKVREYLSSCDPPKDLPTFAYGSRDWFMCGNVLTGTTRSCEPAHGYDDVCCCKAGSLNGPYSDVEEENGCTQTCDADTAASQRALQQRIALVVEEFNTDSCNYGESIAGFELASVLRNHMEMDYYKDAMGHTLTVDDVEKEEQNALEIAAESFVQLEEGQGSFLELDSGVVAVIIICAVLFVLFILWFICPACLGLGPR